MTSLVASGLGVYRLEPVAVTISEIRNTAVRLWGVQTIHLAASFFQTSSSQDVHDWGAGWH